MIFSSMGFLFLVCLFFIAFGFFFLDIGVWSVECWLSLEVVSLGVGLLVVSRGGVDVGGGVGLKYLLIQMIMGAMVLAGIVLGLEWMLVLGLSYKLGVVPGFVWVVDVFSGLSLFACYLVSTLTKVIPLVLLYQNLAFSIWWVVVGSIVVGSFWGVNFSDIRQVLGCSSIISMGWLLSFVVCDSLFMMMLCLFMYVFFMGGFFVFSGLVSIVSSGSDKISLSLFLFGLLGLPSFVIFYIKFFMVMGLLDYWLLFVMYTGGYGGIVMYIRLFYMNWVNSSFSLLGVYNSSGMVVYFVLMVFFFVGFYLFV